MIINCGSNEKGTYKGGTPGDQTGKEWYIRGDYEYPWTHILRHPHACVANIISYLAQDAALNDKIGYDQPTRITFYNKLRQVGYNPTLIQTACSADCSSGVSAIVVAAGYLLDYEGLKLIDVNSTTRNLRENLKHQGFVEISGARLNGDILLAEGKHVAIYYDFKLRMDNEDLESVEDVAVAPARLKDSKYSSYFITSTSTDLKSSPTGTIIKRLNSGQKVRCYGYYTGEYLLVQIIGTSETGYVALKDLC